MCIAWAGPWAWGPGGDMAHRRPSALFRRGCWILQPTLCSVVDIRATGEQSQLNYDKWSLLMSHVGHTEITRLRLTLSRWIFSLVHLSLNHRLLLLLTLAWVKLKLYSRRYWLFIPKRLFQLTVALCWRGFSPGWLNFCGHCHHLVAFCYWFAGAALFCPVACPHDHSFLPVISPGFY